MCPSTEYSILFPLSLVDFPSQIILIGTQKNTCRGILVLDPMTFRLDENN
jgi:hypothetical protein